VVVDGDRLRFFFELDLLVGAVGTLPSPATVAASPLPSVEVVDGTDDSEAPTSTDLDDAAEVPAEEASTGAPADASDDLPLPPTAANEFSGAATAAVPSSSPMAAPRRADDEPRDLELRDLALPPLLSSEAGMGTSDVRDFELLLPLLCLAGSTEAATVATTSETAAPESAPIAVVGDDGASAMLIDLSTDSLLLLLGLANPMQTHEVASSSKKTADKRTAGKTTRRRRRCPSLVLACTHTSAMLTKSGLNRHSVVLVRATGAETGAWPCAEVSDLS
jgi:hypothetical protein